MMIIKPETIVAIIRDVDPLNVVEIQEILLESGVDWVEVSLSEEKKGLECIKRLSQTFGNQIHLGVGTVTSVNQAKKAISAGAKYIITPGWDKDLIQEIMKLNISILPGVLTPGEILQAINLGINTVKLFPANNLGTDYIKNLKGPFPNLNIMAVGGISIDNIKEYKKAGCTSFGIGSDLVPRGANREDVELIKSQATKYVSLLKDEGRLYEKS